MFIRYLASPRYTAEINKLQDYLDELKSSGGLDDSELRNILNRIISRALQLRVNIEHEKLSRGEIEEE